MAEIFEFRDYKHYLSDLSERSQAVGRGYGRKLAEAAGCRTAYISQVLRGSAQLSLEQALGISRMLGHSDHENEFFLLLVQHERASTIDLKSYFKRKIDTLARNRLQKKMPRSASLPDSSQATYYASWYFIAVHMALTIDGLREPLAIAQRLSLSLERVREVLEFLENAGLVLRKGTEYHSGSNTLHLSPKSGWTARHHANWRLQAIKAFDRGSKPGKSGPDLHYSSVLTISHQDAILIKDRLLREVSAIAEIVTPSPSEELFSFDVDFFAI
jgi:uncharacterized protein (TIGR02147 family)